MNATQKRTAGLATLIAKQVYGLAIDHFDKAEEYAANSDLDGLKPVKASLTFKATWEAGSQEATINTGVRYTLTAKDETEDTFDPNQATMDFDPTTGEITTTEQD